MQLNKNKIKIVDSIVNDGIEILTKHLSLPQLKITEINLGYNALTDECAISLVPLLHSYNKKISKKPLNVLNLETNEIGEKGTQELCNALKFQKEDHLDNEEITINELNLCYNGIRCKGAMAIADILLPVSLLPKDQ